MKILEVIQNNRRKAFTIRVDDGEYDFPYAKLSVRPASNDRVVEAFADEEAGGEAFTYRLESGAEDTVHLDAVLEYNHDPTYLNEVLLHRLTVEANKAVEDSDLSKGSLFATGLIAGGAITGVLAAVLAVLAPKFMEALNFEPQLVGGKKGEIVYEPLISHGVYYMIAVAFFVAMCGILYRNAMKKDVGNR